MPKRVKKRLLCMRKKGRRMPSVSQRTGDTTLPKHDETAELQQQGTSTMIPSTSHAPTEVVFQDATNTVYQIDAQSTEGTRLVIGSSSDSGEEIENIPQESENTNDQLPRDSPRDSVLEIPIPSTSTHPNIRIATPSRPNESAEARERRLSRRRNSRRDAVLLESPNTRAARLTNRNERDLLRRQNESPETRDVTLLARRTSKNLPWANMTPDFWQGAGFNYNPRTNYTKYPSVMLGDKGKFDKQCPHCRALRWAGEPAGMCCSGGKVKLPPLPPPPQVLQDLLNGDSREATHFRGNMARYNSAFTMTSFGVKSDIDQAIRAQQNAAATAAAEAATGEGMSTGRGSNVVNNYRRQDRFFTFKVRGQCYHLMGSLRPVNEEEPKFMQVFFMGDSEQEAARRCALNPRADASVVAQLQTMLHQTHPYVHQFKNALELLESRPEMKVVVRADKCPVGEHPRRYNAPSTNEVAAVVVGEEHGGRDIVLRYRDDSLLRVAQTHKSYDCLQYPIIFCHGEDGYHFDLNQTDPATGNITSKRISCKDFYAYRIMIRPDEFNQILWFKEVTNQFLVDMLSKIRSERLWWVRLNQRMLRVERYIHLQDAMARHGDASNVGSRVILPSSFTGSPRYMQQRFQDAMSFVRKFGTADLFCTFTCNPHWEEIKQNLFRGQNATDRHDIVARAFHGRLKLLLSLLKHWKIYGELSAWMYTVEWQKRGLPHAHILLWCKNKIRAVDVDKIISAEIPDKDVDPLLWKIVTTHLIHGPCGPLNPNCPCMENYKCTKHYPKDLRSATCHDKNGYPLYQRTAPCYGGRTATVQRHGVDYKIDNSWVVPYSPLLAKIFGAHINVELCSSVKSIKYICKYINKGGDMAVLGLNYDDETLCYEMGTWICSGMAVWRILGFDLHESWPPVIPLDVHLENGQRVYFTEENAATVVDQPRETKLTSFFRLCSTDAFAATLLYADVPTYYTWNNNSWQRRKRGLRDQMADGEIIFKGDAIGRVYTVHPRDQECFFLRLLIHHVRGPTSFENLRSYNGVVCQTYREACVLHGLLEDDAHWNVTLTEAAQRKLPKEMRRLFSMMLLFCNISEPLRLWEAHKDSLSEDILWRLQHQDPAVQFNEAIYNEALLDLQRRLQSMGSDGLSAFGLPTPDGTPDNLTLEFVRELSYDVEEMTALVEQDEPRLLPEQRCVYNNILASVHANEGKMFFLDAPGGTGKTFLINLLLAKLRAERQIAIAVASSGIAATLLQGGRTAHSAFRLPLDLISRDQPTCNIARGTAKGNLLAGCSLIIWDEATMANKKGFEALDRTLQDLRRSARLMGGTTVLLAGDFRQTLPIVRDGTRADEVGACLKSSYLWRRIRRLHLTTNMRVHTTGNAEAGIFAQQLLQVGEGTIELGGARNLRLPFGHYLNSADELMACVFPNIETQHADLDWLKGRAILAPHNTTSEELNNKLLDKIPGEAVILHSADSNITEDDSVLYPIEVLNTQSPSGFPPHILRLKVGAPVILLRNLDPPALCNGTRLIVKTVMSKVLELTVLNGPASGSTVFVPPIRLIPSDATITFARVQFPVRLCFAMTINKSQGQSLEVVGLNLAEPVFSHGQLYVGCSRVGNPDNLFIYAPEGKTNNVVYQEALQ